MPDEASEQGTVRYIRCPSCGMPNPGTVAKCARCGQPMQGEEAARTTAAQPPASVLCSKCKKPLPPGSKFCGFCGTPLPAAAPAPAKPPAGQPTAAPEADARAAAPKATPPPPKPAVPASAVPTEAIKVGAPPQVPTPPAPARPAPPARAAEGTQVFTGLRIPKVEASITEVKPDGTTGKTTRIVKETFIGRGPCDLSYPNDMLLTPRHAALSIRTGKVFLKDLNSTNGTFIRQRQDTELTPGDIFLLGRELFRFTTQSMDEVQPSPQGTAVMMGAPKLQRGPVTAKLEHIQLTGEVIEEFSLDKPETTIGRTKGDLLFNNDPYMSGTHARVVAQPGRFILQDLKSRNGVYRGIRAEVELKDGDEFFLGEQLFRVELKAS